MKNMHFALLTVPIMHIIDIGILFFICIINFLMYTGVIIPKWEVDKILMLIWQVLSFGYAMFKIVVASAIFQLVKYGHGRLEDVK